MFGVIERIRRSEIQPIRSLKLLGFLILFISLTAGAARQFYHLLAQRSGAIAITPNTRTIENGMSWKFTGSGGFPPYAYSLVSVGAPKGTIDTTTGVYTADNAGGYNIKVRVTDNSGNFADATVTVPAAPVIVCDVNGVYSSSLNGRLVDSGGPSGNYSDSEYCSAEIRTPTGSSLTLHYNDFDTESGPDILHVFDYSFNGTDHTGSAIPSDEFSTEGYFYFEFESDAANTGRGFDISWSATVSATPGLRPADTLLAASFPTTVEAYGGVGPYTISIVSGGGALSGVGESTATFTAPNDAATVRLRVTDALGQVAEVDINVFKDPLTLTSVTKAHGDQAGGYSIVIAGQGYLNGATVTVDGTNCPANVLTPFSLKCTVPAHAAGKVDVTVTNPGGESFTLPNSFEYQSGTWTLMPAPSTAARAHHAAIWTGDRYIIWGGQDPSCAYANCTKDDGYVYNPLTDSWSAMATSPLSSRIEPANVWTGHEALIVSGYKNAGGTLNEGAKYNPYTNTWTSIAPQTSDARNYFSQVWTGKELILYGGLLSGALTTGWAYNPSSDSWRAIAAGPERFFHQAVWTGSKMIIYGGRTDNTASNASFSSVGAAYDPEADTWTTLAATLLRGKTGIANMSHQANSMYMIWTGEKVYLSGGGSLGSGTKSDAFYDPRTNTWSYPTTQLTGSYATSMVWTGDLAIRIFTEPTFSDFSVTAFNPATDTITQMTAPIQKTQTRALVWTGQDIITCYGYMPAATGGDCERLDLGSLKNRLGTMPQDSWKSMTTTGAPAARANASSLWTGTHMIVWGGSDGSTNLNTGAKYDPIADSWTPITTAGAPSGRVNHTALWTGSSMIVWGGSTSAGVYTNTGGIYNPFTNSWTSTAAVLLTPDPREKHSAVWTGSKMIVWGGWDGGPMDTGGIYNLATDTWTVTLRDVNFTPIARWGHQAVWTGSKMIVWGGILPNGYVQYGSLYDPINDTWTTMATPGSPPEWRVDFSMVYAKGKLVVWGGVNEANAALSSGGLYDVATDSWSTVSTTGAPSARSQASTAFTDRSMIVWGGKNGSTSYDDGFLFNPETNSWSAMSTSGMTARHGASVAWTGSIGDGRANGSSPYRNNTNGDTARLMIWGGFDGTTYKADGKIYRIPDQ